MTYPKQWDSVSEFKEAKKLNNKWNKEVMIWDVAKEVLQSKMDLLHPVLSTKKGVRTHVLQALNFVTMRVYHPNFRGAWPRHMLDIVFNCLSCFFFPSLDRLVDDGRTTAPYWITSRAPDYKNASKDMHGNVTLLDTPMELSILYSKDYQDKRAKDIATRQAWIPMKGVPVHFFQAETNFVFVRKSRESHFNIST